MTHDIIWRCLHFTGHEYARLDPDSECPTLQGSAVFQHEQTNCALSYVIECDREWNTRRATVRGWVGPKQIDVDISVEESRVWLLNGVEQPQVEGCVDIDLNFSPSTNLLPIRRLHLNVGEEAPVKAAWLRFPSFALETLSQTYRRLSPEVYRYKSAGGSFVADLTVNDVGFPIIYPGLWER